MATSTVARTNLSLLSGVLLWFALVSGQSVHPSNASLPSGETIFTQLTLVGGGGPLLTQSVFNIAPLTSSVGLGGSSTAVAQPQFNGPLKQIGPENQNNITSADIAYISCDPNADTSNIDPSSVVSTVGSINPKPQGIILYSISSQECNLNGTFPSSTIYTMTSAQDSRTLLHSIEVGTNIQARVASNTTTAGTGSTTNNDGGPAPTTAVAMSILYSITGIITLLFLIIIATGAIRAHRHPERYGPRTGLAGRPRQSRAKGLARAMLETLPIVKFGDPEPVKPGSRDIELEDGNTSVHNTAEAVTVPTAAGATTSEESKQHSGVTDVESGIGPAQADSIKSGQEATKKEGELGCSICTEDFTTGEDVRVLPCHHKYHPACIDPWLLNVSGTCPLCRHDLRPVTSATDPASPTAEDSELPPPLAANEGSEAGPEIETAESDNASSNNQRRRMSRFLDPNRLRHAPPDERIAALRRLREQSQREPEATEDVEEPSRRARLTGRLRDTFRIRTRAQNDTI